MVGIQIRNEKEEKREDPSGNTTCWVDRERVTISRMVEKKYMAECPTGVPNVQELWILPWSEDDIPPRSSNKHFDCTCHPYEPDVASMFHSAI